MLSWWAGQESFAGWMLPGGWGLAIPGLVDCIVIPGKKKITFFHSRRAVAFFFFFVLSRDWVNNDFVGIDNSVRGINFNNKDLLKQRIVKIVWWNYIMSTQAVGTGRQRKRMLALLLFFNSVCC